VYQDYIVATDVVFIIDYTKVEGCTQNSVNWMIHSKSSSNRVMVLRAGGETDLEKSVVVGLRGAMYIMADTS
jgi:hypothetical protein